MKEPERDRWRSRQIEHLLPWDHKPIRPAEVIDTLCAIVVDRKNMLEDANYSKFAPNRFIVELGEANFQRYYQPIADRIVRQWQDRIQEYLKLTNHRLGKIEYRLGGQLGIELRASEALKEDQARVLFRLDSTADPQKLEAMACVELLADGRRFRLQNGVTCMGRDPTCEVFLNTPEVLARRLVSSRHAYIVCNAQRCRLFDGDPGGGPSLNGTYANNRIVQPAGHELQDGDVIILAALVLGQPRPDTPGVAVLRFIGQLRMIGLFGWAAILFTAKWAFIAVIYLALFVILFAVRRELTTHVRGGQRADALAPGRLRVIAAGSDRSVKAGQLLALKSEALIGAERDNDLVLRDKFISGYHARMYWDGNAWWIEDLGSQNGTQVNQAPAYPHMPVQVPAHARLSFGDMMFELLKS